MVFFARSQTEPSALTTERAKTPDGSGNYRHADIISVIKTDFFDKCYICEQKGVASINIEHLAPHRDIDMNRKYDWNNLFWSCSHCNTIKSSNYDGNLLNCNLRADNVDLNIRYILNPSANEKSEQIVIEGINNTPKIDNTVDLLTKVYKGTTDLNKHHSVLLRNKIYDEVCDFKCISDKYLITEDQEKKELYLFTIKNSLSNKSPFSAFKRDIVRNNTRYNELISFISP